MCFNFGELNRRFKLPQTADANTGRFQANSMRTKPIETARALQSVALRYRRGPSVRDRRLGLGTVNVRRRSSRIRGAPPANATEAAGNDARLSRLEAILFLAREPLNSRKLSQLAGLADGTEARTLVRALNRQYDQRRTAFRVEQIAGGYQLLTRPQFAPWLRRLQHVPSETRLSAPALETLAVVAYRQPVLRADVEAIRGVSCGEILRQLMERDLVRIGGRSEELGRPYLYATTKRFLQTFGLHNLEELPRADTLRLGAAAITRNESDNQPGSALELNAGPLDNSHYEEEP